MTPLKALLERTATWRGFAILLALYVVVFGMILATTGKLTAHTGGIGILDFERGYSYERVLEILGSYGPEGMALFARIQFFDLFNPAIYGLIFASIIYLLWKDSNVNWLPILPFFAAGLDYCENLTLFLLARSYPEISSGLVTLSSGLSLAKNVTLFAAIAALLLGLMRLGFSWTKRKQP